jgi:hypothetical protein
MAVVVSVFEVIIRSFVFKLAYTPWRGLAEKGKTAFAAIVASFQIWTPVNSLSRGAFVVG